MKILFSIFCFSLSFCFFSQKPSRDQKISVQTLLNISLNDGLGNVPVLADKILAVDSNCADIIAHRALYYYKKKNYGESLKDFERYLKLRPKSPFCIYRAPLRLETGDTAGAWTDIINALNLSGYDPVVLEKLGDFFGSLKDTKKLSVHFEKATKFQPHNPIAYSILGILRDKQGDDREALKCYNKAVQSLDYCVMLGREKYDWLFWLQAEKSYKLGKYEEAIKAVSECILINPKPSDNLFYYEQRMKYFLAAKKHKEAMADECILQAFGKHAIPIHLNCDCTEYKPSRKWLIAVEAENLYHKGRSFKGNDSALIRSALKSYSEALELKPDHLYARAARAGYYLLLEQFDNSIKDLDGLLTYRPKNAEAYHFRSVAKRRLNNYKDAVRDAEKAVLFDSTNIDYRINLVAMLNDQGDTTRALKEITVALKLNPYCARAYLERGILRLYAKKEYEGALDDFQQAIEIAEGYPMRSVPDHYYYFCAVALDKLKRYNQAFEVLENAIVLSPRTGSYYYFAGEIKARLKDMERACVEWKKSKQLGDKNAEEVLHYNCK